MIKRDDWLSPSAFVAGIDLGGETGGSPTSPAQPAAPVVRYDAGWDDLVPVTQEWVNSSEQRLKQQFAELERLRNVVSSALRRAFDYRMRTDISNEPVPNKAGSGLSMSQLPDYDLGNASNSLFWGKFSPPSTNNAE